MRKLRLYTGSLVVFGILWLAAPCAAFSQDVERYTLDQAVALVKKTFGGQVLKAESTERDGRLVHQIRVLTEDGRVRTFTVDANDGLIP